MEQREIDNKTILLEESGLSAPASPNPAGLLTSNQYIVRVGDNFHFPDIEEYTQGTYPTYAEALAICKQMVDEFLTGECQPGMSAAALHDQYTSFGEDPYIIGDRERFSAWAYAKERCEELCMAR